VITFSEPRDQIVAGLFLCDKNLGDLKKNATNPHFKSKYADLGATCDAIQTGLDAGKLLVVQAPLAGPDGTVGVETMLLHESGQWMRPDPLFLPLAKVDPQGAGSAITYARRYALAAVFNLAPEDDDANLASTRARTKAPRAAVTPTPRRQPPASATPIKDDLSEMTVTELHNEIYGLLCVVQIPKEREEAAVQWASTGRSSDYQDLDDEESRGLVRKLRLMPAKTA
jgi:hypothetical protein